MTRQRYVLGTLAAFAMVIGTVRGAGGDPGEATHVDLVEASLVGPEVSVSGEATFVDTPKTVGTDPEGDAATPLPGTDITSATIARTPGSSNLTFTLGLKDMAPTGGTPGYLYRWSVSGGAGDFTLEAGRGAADFCGAEGITTDPVFRLFQGSIGFESRTPLGGSFANNEVTFEDVPLDKLGAGAGSVISTWGLAPTARSIVGLSGCFFIEAPSAGDDIALQDYVVPGATVRLGIAPAGTPENDVALTVVAELAELAGDGTSSFSGSLPRPATAGDYVVVARACYVPDVCGLKSTTVTI